MLCFTAAAAAAASAATAESEGAAIGVESETTPRTSRASGTTAVNNSTFQLLQAHGITMLPTDESTTVESAMESGQTVVLTGAVSENLTPLSDPFILEMIII